MELRRLKTRNLQDQIQEELKLYIISRSLKRGDPLPAEKVLAEGLGTSRTVVRESLKSLESLGFIEVKPGIGRFIRGFNFEAILNNLPYGLDTDVRSFKEILEIRVGLETHFLSRDLRLFSAADVAELEGLVADLGRLVEGGSPEEKLIGLHTDFHCRLYRNSDNRLLIELIRIFATIQRNLTLHNRYRSSDRPLFVRLHADIVEAIKSGNPEAVRKVVIEHFREPMSWVEKNLGPAGGPENESAKEDGRR